MRRRDIGNLLAAVPPDSGREKLERPFGARPTGLERANAIHIRIPIDGARYGFDCGRDRLIQRQVPESGLASHRVSVEDGDLRPIPG